MIQCLTQKMCHFVTEQLWSSEEDNISKHRSAVYGYVRKKTRKLKASPLSNNGIPSEVVEIVLMFYGNGTHGMDSVVVKVGMLGDAQTGKTQLMAKYTQGEYDPDYIETLGVNFLEKTIPLKNTDVTISIWDLGGQREFATLMPLICSDAKVILFVFDLMQKQSLFSVKRWYKEARKESKVRIS